MKNIDFLPERYRRQRLQRRAHVWEIAVTLLFAGIVGVTAAAQLSLRWRAAAQLEATESRYQQALRTMSSYGQLQANLTSTSQVADLYVYLEHPWPRTQVIKAVLDHLPDDVVLTSLHLTHEPISTTPAAVLSDEERAKLSPAQRDLAHLRRDADRRRAVVWIEGATEDPVRVYELAQRLGQSRPFASVNLESVERESSDRAKRATFKLKGVLAPGYGQPGSRQPADPKPNSQLANTAS